MNITFYQVDVMFDPYGGPNDIPKKEILGKFSKKKDAEKLINEWIEQKNKYFKNGRKKEDRLFKGRSIYWEGYDNDPFIRKISLKID